MEQRRPAGGTALALILVALVAFGGTPAQAKHKKKEEAESAAKAPLVWPLPPDPPRIRYVGALHGSQDFKRKQSRFKRFLLGPDRDRGISLVKPYGVTTDSSGRVYVTDTGLGAVVVFDRTARKVTLIGREGRVRLVTPIGVAVGPDGRLYVSDVDLDRVVVYGPDREILMVLGSREKLANPAGIALDAARGRLYVADSHRHALFIYSTADGTLLETWGRRGTGDGEFNFPTNVALDRQGRVYVVDTGNFRVQVFAPDGSFVRKFGRAGDALGNFHRPKGIAVDSEDHVYVVDAAFNNFQIFDQQARLLLFVGQLGRQAGEFWLPAGMHIDGDDRIYVADQVNRRVQIFQYLEQGPAGAPAGPGGGAMGAPAASHRASPGPAGR
ncbi:MAG: 6-bladed beta-propeller [Acidobacteria bacterium]|nr:MAG: 6-bladed beta-propeller [Acidobacteriota bacterium]